MPHEERRLEVELYEYVRIGLVVLQLCVSFAPNAMGESVSTDSGGARAVAVSTALHEYRQQAYVKLA